jgi:peptidyl-prolyl cis-trans isomerase B (cyclophilin B)
VDGPTLLFRKETIGMRIDPRNARLGAGDKGHPIHPLHHDLKVGGFSAGIALLLLLTACNADILGSRSEAPPAASPTAGLPKAEVAEGPHDVAVVEVKDLGTIRFELLSEVAPKAVENFVKLAEDGVYDGTTFHRVIPGFMIQGGDPNSKDNDPRNDGRGGPGFRVEDEFTDFPHLRGVVAMANHGSPNSAGSQFFIVHQDTPDLDGRYTVFGVVIEGLEVVAAVTQLEIDEFGRYGPPERPYPVSAVMEQVRIEPAS